MPELRNGIFMQLEEPRNKLEQALPVQDARGEGEGDNWSRKISKAIAARQAGQEARKDSPPTLSTNLRTMP